MAYVVWLTVDATLAFPLAPMPPGHWTELPLPIALFQSGLTRAKYLVNQLVVPELSDLWAVVIAWFGKVKVGLMAVIAGSFQFVIVPK